MTAPSHFTEEEALLFRLTATECESIGMTIKAEFLCALTLAASMIQSMRQLHLLIVLNGQPDDSEDRQAILTTMAHVLSLPAQSAARLTGKVVQ